jgi:uncharacterized protein YjbI with pentapeptide repeats
MLWWSACDPLLHSELLSARKRPMTETEYILLLRKGADAWNGWRGANPSIRPDLREANLNGANLHGAFLRGADLGKANLNRANLSNAILGGADLSDADLSGANLSRANLGSAILNGANVSRANFSEANLSAADLSGTNLSLANFSGATLSGADLSRASLTGALLRGANLDGATLASANLSGANLAGAYMSGAAAHGANLRGADLSKANLIGANFNGANLSLANLSSANLTGTELVNADLSGATLTDANFSLSNLSNAELTGVRWQLHAMRGCYLGIRGLDSCFGNALFKRAAADQDFLDTLEAHLKGTRRMVLFRAWGLIDYGRSLLRVAVISFSVAAFYGAIYRIFPTMLEWKDSAKSWFTPYYFSIVTYTTLGFGDVRPATLAGEIIVSSEVILGYTTLGLLLAVLAQSIARRS